MTEIEKIKERIIEEINNSGGLILQEKTENLSRYLIDIVLYEFEPKEGIKYFLKKYYGNLGTYVPSEEEVEKMLSGMLAFFWVNFDGESYHPVFMYPEQEKTKKWWEFWK